MMVKRPVFETVGGFNEELKVAFNDVDFCLSVRKAGYLVVYCPYAELYHYESRSRGMEDTPEKIARFNQEADIFLKRWPSILKTGIPTTIQILRWITMIFRSDAEFQTILYVIIK